MQFVEFVLLLLRLLLLLLLRNTSFYPSATSPQPIRLPPTTTDADTPTFPYLWHFYIMVICFLFFVRAARLGVETPNKTINIFVSFTMGTKLYHLFDAKNMYADMK